ncbi:MAG: methyltransferase domain-containing protein [Pseudomonadota bacterium]
MSATVRNIAPGQAPGVEPLRLNLGCGRTILPGWINVDKTKLPGVDVGFDLNDCSAWNRMPFADDSVESFLLSHTIEHITNTLPLMQELHRIAKPGATIQVRVPYGSSDDADEDPTHVRRYFLQSWLYFAQPAYWRADYSYRGDWQAETIELVVPAGRFDGLTYGAALNVVRAERNVVREMIATLRAVKPIREPKRELQVSPEIKFVVLP